MIDRKRPDRVIAALIAWGEADTTIRALILTSSRAVPDMPTERLSDYDLIVVLADVDRFLRDEGWLQTYGTPIVRFNDHHVLNGHDTYARLVLYEDGTKIDYTLWPVALLQKVAAAPQLPDDLDVGYRILLDKDGLTDGIVAPTYAAHIPVRPTEAEYLALVHEFWWEITYVAKNLWRDELFPARYSFDTVIKYDLLRRLLEWAIEGEHGWRYKPGNLGRGLKGALPTEVWSEVESTFIGANIEENWQALFTATALFRRIATTVAHALGYAYPLELDQRVLRYLHQVRSLAR